MMNPEAKAEFDRIVAGGPDAASESDMAFLQARRSYLTGDQRTIFGLTEPAASTDEAPAPRKSRKSASTDEA